jgi:hypothetical protein
MIMTPRGAVNPEDFDSRGSLQSPPSFTLRRLSVGSVLGF